MQTVVQTPMDVFGLPQHLQVPLFQRPYVWNEDDQWTPLWGDIRRLTELRMSGGSPTAQHFLGAVVLQQQLTNLGQIQAWSVIDGQQRLTTLQLLMDAAAGVLEDLGHFNFSQQLATYTHNAAHFTSAADEQLKVQHTNRDRAAFREVMNGAPPIVHGSLVTSDSRITQAHRFFADRVREWLLADGADAVGTRAAHLVPAITMGIQLVVITLQPDENSQEIFETLNARGAPLTAADLIKNLVFQRLESEDFATGVAYRDYWSLFEHRFWEQEVSIGRYSINRLSLFLNHWLVAQTGEEVSTRSTFNRFKHFVEHEAKKPMVDVLKTLHKQASLFQAWIEGAARRAGDLSTVELFIYRTQAADIEAVKPVLLWLYDVDRSIPGAEAEAALRSIESWVMRRSLMRLQSSDLSRTVADLISANRLAPPDETAARVTAHLTRLSSAGTYWPGDNDLVNALAELPAYRRYKRGRLRMFLETAEDHLRGFTGPKPSKTGTRVERGVMAVEHLLPQKWKTHWAVEELSEEIERDKHVHRFGNLTLLTGSLNSSVSNGAWQARRPEEARRVASHPRCPRSGSRGMGRRADRRSN